MQNGVWLHQANQSSVLWKQGDEQEILLTAMKLRKVHMVEGEVGVLCRKVGGGGGGNVGEGGR